MHVLLAGVYLGRLRGLGFMVPWSSCTVGYQQSCLCLGVTDPAVRPVYAKKGL